MTDIRDTVAEAIYHAHRPYKNLDDDENAFIYRQSADAAIAAYLDTLAAERKLVVELPEPAYGPDGGGQYAWKSGAPSNITASPDDDGVWSVWDEDFQMTPDEARDTAAALLSAAERAEEADL